MTNSRLMGFIKRPLSQPEVSGHIKILILLAGVNRREMDLEDPNLKPCSRNGSYSNSTFIPRLYATNDHSSAV